MSLWRPLGWRSYQRWRNALINLRDLGACLVAFATVPAVIWLAAWVSQ